MRLVVTEIGTVIWDDAKLDEFIKETVISLRKFDFDTSCTRGERARIQMFATKHKMLKFRTDSEILVQDINNNSILCAVMEREGEPYRYVVARNTNEPSVCYMFKDRFPYTLSTMEIKDHCEAIREQQHTVYVADNMREATEWLNKDLTEKLD